MSHDSTNLIETVPAVAGLIFSLASAVQFMQTTVTIGNIGYTFQPQHSFVVSLAALVVVFASSKTKNWEMYESWEQVLVGVFLFIMTIHNFIPLVQRTVSNQQPLSGSAAFLLGVAAWGVLAR